jgi:hypothetical protein
MGFLGDLVETFASEAGQCVVGFGQEVGKIGGAFGDAAVDQIDGVVDEVDNFISGGKK